MHMCECSELHIHQGCDNNMPQTDHLNDKRVFLPVLDAGKFKIKVLSDSVPGGSPLPAADGHLLIVSSLSRESARKARFLLSLLLRTLIPP